MQNQVSRRAAQALGLKRFYTGVPCGKGHVAERYVCNGGCLECMAFRTPPVRNKRAPRNVAWPVRPFVFNVPEVTPEEVQATFLYMQHLRWHDYALLELRKDIKLLAQFTPMISDEEELRMQKELDKRAQMKRRLRGED